MVTSHLTESAEIPVIRLIRIPMMQSALRLQGIKVALQATVHFSQSRTVREISLEMEVQVPEVFKKPLLVPNKTLMGSGPSNATRRVLDSMSNPLLAECHPECLQVCLQKKYI